YVLDQAERIRWPAFEGVPLRPDVARDLRRWTLVGENRGLEGGEPNYETQQSPLFYWMAGLLVRLRPARSPLGALYRLRPLNAAPLIAAAGLTARAARRLYGDRGWLPLAYLALMPGLAMGLTRVSNDALAALLISAAVAATLPQTATGAGVAGSL